MKANHSRAERERLESLVDLCGFEQETQPDCLSGAAELG